MNKLFILFTISTLTSCTSKSGKTEHILTKTYDTIIVTEKIVDTVFIEKKEADITQSIYYVQERLPMWFLMTNLLVDLKLEGGYILDNRLNPFYFEEDFNGDDHLDIIIPIKRENDLKQGFAIIHGHSNEVYIIGAGTTIKNGISDDLNYYDIWKINREQINMPGLEEYSGTGDKGELFLENPSIYLEKSELGGGQVYWNGVEYAYFHQTC